MKLSKIQASIDSPRMAKSKPFFDHVRYLFPIDAEYKWILQWIAHGIQNPADRCQVTPLHISIPHGTGRGSLTNMLILLYGSWNCATANILDLSRATNDFNGQFLNEKLLVFIHEVQQRKGRYEIDSDMRSILSDRYLDINNKYGTRGSERVFVNFMMFSNHPDALVLTELDRRINVLTGPEHIMPSEYYDNLIKYIEDAEEERHLGLPNVFYWMLGLDLSDFNSQRAPDSPARKRMIAAGKDDAEAMVDEWLITNTWHYMTFKQIRESIMARNGIQAFSDDFDISNQRLSHILTDEGCIKWNQTRIDGEAVRLWSLRGPNVVEDDDSVSCYQKYKAFLLENKPNEDES